MDNEATKEVVIDELEEVEEDDGVVQEGAPSRLADQARRQRALYALMGLLLLGGIALLAAGMVFSNKAGMRATPVAIPSVGALLTPNTQVDASLGSILGELQRIYVREGEAPAREFAQNSGLLDATGRVYLTLDLDTEDIPAQDELVRQLEALGVQIDNRYSKSLDVSFTLEQLGKALEIPTVGVGTPIALPTSIGPDNLPPSLLQKLADLKHVARVRQTISPSPQGLPYFLPLLEGPEGVQVVKADEWQRQGFTGKGLKIGIIDVGGFMGYEEMLGKELPEKVTVKAFNRSRNIEGNPGVDEGDRVHGTACAEIIHAMAPDAELYFAAFDSNEENAIKWLISQDVDIISASYGGHYYPSDGKHHPAIPLINRTHDQGVFWALSAGNEGDAHYKGRFEQGEDGLNIFYNGSNVLGFRAFRPGMMQITLRWDDWESSTVDYNLSLLDSNHKELISSEDRQTGPPSEPAEFLRYELPEDGQYYIAISGKRGVKAVDYDIFIRGAVELEKTIAQGSIGSPGDAAGALTVGAVRWDENTITDYSSQGPTDDGRVKPEISAPSGVTSRSYGRFGDVFNGTSASAPFVAGAAALVLSANPGMKPDDVQNFLLQRAKDLGDPGVDNTYGYGLLDLGTGPSAAITVTPVPPTIGPTTEPPTQGPGVTPEPPTEEPATPTQVEERPTTVPLVPTPGSQPTAAPIPPSSIQSDAGSGGVLWMAIAGGSMVGLSLIMGLVLFAASRRRASRPPLGYGWPPPQGGPYPQQPPSGYPGYYPGQQPPGNWPPPQAQGQAQPQQLPYGQPQGSPQYRQAPPGYPPHPLPQPGQGQQPGYPPQYPLQQPPQSPGYSQGYPPQPTQGQLPQQGYAPQPQPGYGSPPAPPYTQPQQGPGQTPPSTRPAYPPGAMPTMPTPPPQQQQQPQAGYPVPPQPPAQPPAQGASPGAGRGLPPPPKGMSPCPNCGRALAPNAAQCGNCGWRKP